MNEGKEYVQIQGKPQPNNQRREIGDDAVWTLSSAKPGNGVDQLRDGDEKTFCQIFAKIRSDGNQPHLINIQFLKKMRVQVNYKVQQFRVQEIKLHKLQEVAMYLDFKTDESYTPSKISIRAGTNLQDLKENVYVELVEPSGWYIFPLKTKLLDESEKPYILTMNLQIAILQNQHSGKDTHIRQVLVFGPREKQNQGLGFPDFKSPEITQYYSIR